jgi:hypothetical protein
MFERRKRSEKQGALWVMVGELPATTPDGFCRRVNATLERMNFAREA